MIPDGGLTRLGLYAKQDGLELKSFIFPDKMPATNKPLNIFYKPSEIEIKNNLMQIKTGEELNLASLAYGAKLIKASNEHYGPAIQVISPFSPINMFDGLESARSRIKDHFEEVKTTISDRFGWWQSVAVADVNNDGKQDLILGNIGDNFYLCPKTDSPAKLWMNDYDKNGDIDKIMTYTINGKDMPVFLKRDMQDQLPSLKKENLKHSDYANKSIQDLFSKEMIASSTVKKFTYAPSCVAINEGNGKFTVKELPVMSQLSCINAIQTIDVNNDGFIDLVTGGNQFGFLPQFEKLDASFGDVLINDGKGNFVWQDARKTGLNLRGELRDIAKIKNSKGTYLLFLQNNEFPFLYKLNDGVKKK